MNILPKKSWHVRTRENIARVRRDEAQAAVEEKKRQQSIALAEQESRTASLREKIRGRYKDELPTVQKVEVQEVKKGSVHVNLFEDLESGKVVSDKVNEEHELEKKTEREVYEKRIGYLTYLGQDTVELTGNVSWYNKAPPRHRDEDPEVNASKKYRDDPLKLIRKYVPQCAPAKSLASGSQKRSLDGTDGPSKGVGGVGGTPLKVRKREGNSSRSTSSKQKVDVEKLRAERLAREKKEKSKQEALLAKLSGLPPPSSKQEPSNVGHPVKQKYNSQFNPELAKQNYNHRGR